jgi:hypothetical protein
MAIEKVVNIKVNDDVQETTKNVVSLKTQLRQAQNEVNELSARFGATSEQAVNAARRAAELADAIGDARALTDAFNPDAKFKALTATLGGVAGGFSAVQGAVALLGEESENVEKLILKVQSAMAISQGVQAIGESVDSFRQLGAVIRSTTLFQKALSAATAIQTFVMNGATLAAKALRGALIATGVGALVVGVGLLIANFDKVKKVVLNLVPQLAMVGDVVMSIVNAVTDFVGATSEAERAADRAKTNAEKRSKDIDRILKEDGSRYSESAKKKMAIEKQLQDDIAEGLYNETKLRKEAAFAIAQIDKENADNAEKKRKEEQDKRNEEAKKRTEDAKKLKEENDKKAKEEKERKDKELQDFETFQSAVAGAKEAQNKIDIENAEMQFEALTEVSDKFYNENEEQRIARETKTAEDLIRFEDDKNKVLASSKENLNNIISGLESSGLAKTKAGQVASKAIALTQIAIDSAVALSKASTLANAEGVAAQLAFPTLPGAGTVARVISYASTALSVASNITRAKALLSSGGSGSVSGSSPSGGSGGGQAPAPPQFNIVGQSGTNQLAQTIAGQQNKPIEAFVVSSAVTTSQALDRNRVKTATFGG